MVFVYAIYNIPVPFDHQISKYLKRTHRNISQISYVGNTAVVFHICSVDLQRLILSDFMDLPSFDFCYIFLHLNVTVKSLYIWLLMISLLRYFFCPLCHNKILKTKRFRPIKCIIYIKIKVHHESLFFLLLLPLIGRTHLLNLFLYFALLKYEFNLSILHGSHAGLNISLP